MERMVSSITRRNRALVWSWKTLRKPPHILGASSIVKNVITAIVTIDTNVEKAAAPTENAVAGFSTLVICDVIFDELSERYFCRWKRYTRWPSQPWPFFALSIRLGSSWPKFVAAVTSGEANR